MQWDQIELILRPHGPTLLVRIQSCESALSLAEEVWAKALEAGLPPRQQGRREAKRTPYPDVGARKLPLAPPQSYLFQVLLLNQENPT